MSRRLYELRRRRQQRGGFTLMEVLLVLVILVALASMTVPMILNLRAGADDDQARTQAEVIKKAVETYHLHLNRFPESLQDLLDQPGDVSSAKWRGPYLDKGQIPRDPWGREYQYRLEQSGGRIDQVVVYSMGRDGQEGSEDDISTAYANDER